MVRKLNSNNENPYNRVIDREIDAQFADICLLPVSEKEIRNKLNAYIYDVVSFDSVKQQVQEAIAEEVEDLKEDDKLRRVVAMSMYPFVHGYFKDYWFSSVCRDIEPDYSTDINLVYGAYYSKAKVQVFIETDISFEEPWIVDTFKKLTDIPIMYYDSNIQHMDKMAIIISHTSELMKLFEQLHGIGYLPGEVEVNGNDIPYKKYLNVSYESCGYDALEEDDRLSSVINTYAERSAYCRVTKDFVGEFYSYVSSLLKFPEEAQYISSELVSLLESVNLDKIY